MTYKKIFFYALISFLVLMILSIIFSYEDRRPVDANLSYGFPLTIYEKTAGFGFPVQSHFYLLNLIADIFLICAVSVILAYAFLKIKDKV